ncbi:LysR family transcriptional regulator [Hoeflea ulvae]|uniref:LysR family transcriptional regulator n=1 Tax=Hoeflea ulvae TaxID=2983764 RepID=A0ABT3YDE1_9HYPH|nr:LysR family transcriptional regulator [Hoeflea ulvae]MCY0093707.1 LysR family transcriptional regulator [Hoeflea ulvae]
MIKSQITLKQLEAFVCVVDMGSFRKAAAVLGTTQPNISNRISTLEDSIGIVLMHRDAGSVRLSEKGEALLATARQVLWNAEAFLEVAERQDLIADRMRLGVTELIASTWLHVFLRRFREAYPSVAVELEVELSTGIEQKLAAGQIDLALQTGPFLHESTDSLALGTCPYIWIAPPELIARTGPKTRLAELLLTPVLIHARHTLASKELLKFAETRKLATDRIVFSSSLASCVQMAVDGMGAALLPAALVREQIESGTLVVLDCDWHPKPLEFFARFNGAKVSRFVEAAARLAVEVATGSGGRINSIDHPS